MKEIRMGDVLKQFGIIASVEKFGNGIINDTYLIKEAGVILQKININVFKNPDELMENIVSVTSFLRNKISQNGEDPNRGTLNFVKTVDGKNYYEAPNGECFRVYRFVDKVKTIEIASSADDMYNAGKGFGKFLSMLDDFHAENLHETIVNFHNTKARVQALKKAIEMDPVGRVKQCKNEIDCAIEMSTISEVVLNGLEDGSIPVRVVHNDTKINNLLFDEKTGEPICVIDLDTVMPGSMLYDFGDAVRVGASNTAEDDPELSNVSFNIEKFAGFAKGYLEIAKDKLSKKEIELLAFSGQLITYELAVRFLTDYILGDVYFKTTHDKHNLERAKNQFTLAKDIESKMEELNNIVMNLC